MFEIGCEERRPRISEIDDRTPRLDEKLRADIAEIVRAARRLRQVDDAVAIAEQALQPSGPQNLVLLADTVKHRGASDDDGDPALVVVNELGDLSRGRV